MSTAVLCLFLLGPAQRGEVKLKLPGASPVFGLAKASQDGKSVALTHSSPANRLQSYTVNVPVVEVRKDKDGNEQRVTVTKQEVRTRVVPNVRSVEQTYTVMVPTKKTRENADGTETEVTVMVPQTRTRMVQVIGGAGLAKPLLLRIADCKFADIEGKPVHIGEVKKRLQKKRPIVILQAGEKLDPFYQAALNPNILLLTLSAVKPKAAADRPDEKAKIGPLP